MTAMVCTSLPTKNAGSLVWEQMNLAYTGVVLQKLVVDTGTVRASYLGPPPSIARSGGVIMGGMGGGGMGGSAGTGADAGASNGGTSNGGAAGDGNDGAAGDETGGASTSGDGAGASAGTGTGGATGNGATRGDDAGGGPERANFCDCSTPGRHAPSHAGAAFGALAILLLGRAKRRRSVRALTRRSTTSPTLP